MIPIEILLPELVVSFIFGFALDFGDLLDEHGLKWFRGAALLFGIVYGAAAVLMIFIYPPAILFLFGLFLYWLIVGKIDYLNHQVATAIFLMGALWQIHLTSVDLFPIFIFLFSYLAVRAIYSFIKRTRGPVRFAVIRHYLPTILLSVVTQNLWFVVINLACTAGTYLSDRWFKEFKKKPDSKIVRKLGLSISSQNQK